MCHILNKSYKYEFSGDIYISYTISYIILYCFIVVKFTNCLNMIVVQNSQVTTTKKSMSDILHHKHCTQTTFSIYLTLQSLPHVKAGIMLSIHKVHMVVIQHLYIAG